MSSVRPVVRPAQRPRTQDAARPDREPLADEEKLSDDARPDAVQRSDADARQATGSERDEGAPRRSRRRGRGQAWSRSTWFLRRVKAYVALTKPRIIELLLVTTLPTMILAERGLPSWGLVVATLVGGAGAAGSANTLNSYLDRDIDRVMNRTRRRPLVTGEIQPRHAVVFGFALGLASVLWLGLAVNTVAAGLTLLAILLYVVGYTLLLKRRTPQNIVWGGAAGCMPVLIGWSAVTGGLSWAPVVLFGIIFFWTPPHYWPLSMRFRRDYAAAGVPMLPVVAADRRVTEEMLAYTAAMVACSLALVPVASMGWIYTATAGLAGGWFTAQCVLLYRRTRRGDGAPVHEMRVFRASITYLTVLFAAIAVDPFVML